MNSNIVIIDTGCANLSSVKFAIERLGFDAKITDSHQQIKQAHKVILPGVGNAKHAMENIHQKQLAPVIQGLTQPVLGFCLGMQLMTESSTELGISDTSSDTVSCLGVIPTQVKPLQANGLRLPHMGWNTLTAINDNPVFSGVNNGDYVYFVHGYAAPVSDVTIAQSHYGEHFSAAIGYNNFVGCQFHPERSSTVGSRIIKNFLTL